MIKYFVFFTLLFSLNAFASEPKLKIELENKNNNLRLYLVNYGDAVLINKRFSSTPYPSFPAEVQFEIVNKEGKQFQFIDVLINEPSLNEQDIILLKRNDIIGCEFHITTLMLFYNLRAGIYKARVIYQNVDEEFKGVYIGRLTSNWIAFEVPEKKEDIVWPGRSKREQISE